MYLVFFFVFVICMLTCHVLAKKKGRNPVAWGVTGAVLGPIGIILVLLLPDKNV